MRFETVPCDVGHFEKIKPEDRDYYKLDSYHCITEKHKEGNLEVQGSSLSSEFRHGFRFKVTSLDFSSSAFRNARAQTALQTWTIKLAS